MVTINDSAAKLAVLIDADNAQPGIVEELLAEIAKYGTAHVKRAYGDWTGTSLRGWKVHLLAQSIQPMQQFSYTTGKNATDAAMIIDAMDLLYSGRFDGFCIVSSDSDFTRLAQRIRETGLIVYGFGEKKTPQPFVKACDRFTYTENLAYVPSPAVPVETVIAPAEAVPAEAAPKPRAAATAVAQFKGDAALVKLLRNAIEAASDDDGWAALANVGSILTKQRPDFDSRTYGYPKLSDLMAAAPFELDRRDTGAGKSSVIYVRDKRRRPEKRPATVGPAAGGEELE